MPFDLDEKFIIASERALGTVFPDRYRKAMKIENGGECVIAEEVWQLHPMLDKKTRKRLARTCNDVVRETKVMGEWSGWPVRGIAIGANGCGDVILFLREKKNCDPRIFEWSHETGELKFVANDFAELNRL